MKVSINARNINQVVNADTAHVGSPPASGGAPAAPAPAPPLAPALPEGQERSFAHLPGFADDLAVLRQLVVLDHGSALNKMRSIIEKVLHQLCQSSGTGWGQGEPTLERMIGPLLASGVLPKPLGVHVRTVQTNASPGSHYQESPLSAAHVRIALAALEEVLSWFAEAPHQDTEKKA